MGVVLYLVAAGSLSVAHDAFGLPASLVRRFAGLDELPAPPAGPLVIRAWRGHGIEEFVELDELRRWLNRLSMDRSDFAPAVPRALPGGRA